MGGSTVRAVAFDLDGTLFDDRQYARAGLINAGGELRRRTGVALTEELLSAYFRDGHREATFDVVLSAAGLADDHVPALVSAYHDNDAPLVPYRDAAGTLETLATDYRLGVITGGTNGREKLSRLDLDGPVEEIIVTAERPDSKRAPEPFVEMAERLGVPERSMAFVGDRPGLDFPQPNRLEMPTVRVMRGRYADAVARNGATPDAAVESLDAVPEVLARFDGQ
ncbi:HAD family hydrolase [Haloarcula laminariae]|uniref:HAD family hydrolase n=1 Tax=Haloarcula laminariae TaxID=2961577 RepID=UPI0024050EEC|nr:HAD family hydrolase [Halomicroarcula sp. FL173]